MPYDEYRNAANKVKSTGRDVKDERQREKERDDAIDAWIQRRQEEIRLAHAKKGKRRR